MAKPEKKLMCGSVEAALFVNEIAKNGEETVNQNSVERKLICSEIFLAYNHKYGFAESEKEILSLEVRESHCLDKIL